MVCGIDTYHSVDTRSSSVGAFVSSLNSECTRWCSHVDFQGAKIEFLNSLSSFMTVALSEYYKVFFNFFNINLAVLNWLG